MNTTTHDQSIALPVNPRFDGADYQPDRDDKRLTGQLYRVFEATRDGRWRTLDQIVARIANLFEVEDPEPSISAQLRHLRKERFGGHTVNKRHVGNGLYEYQVIPAEPVRDTLFG